MDSKYTAKIAERELLLKDQMTKAVETGDYEALEQLQKQLASDRKTIRAELDDKKAQVREGKAGS